MEIYQKIDKQEIAERQLVRAIELYIEGSDLVSAITLAGAAEEILGELAKTLAKKHALETKAEMLSKIYQHTFKKPPNPKKFISHMNRAKNELKHIGTGTTLKLDLETEAVELIERAITNYNILGGKRNRLFHDFRQESVRRHEERSKRIG
jgi:hypothetical protein